MQEKVVSTIENAVQYAISKQSTEGFWRGYLLMNNTLDAEYIFLQHFLNNVSPLLLKVANRILECQRKDGTWGLYYQAPGDLNTTVECYFALKLSGIDSDTPEMCKARKFILKHGGVEKTRFFTKFWLALLGQWPWQNLPVVLPEIILLPDWFPLNIYQFSSWARGCMVPISLILTKKPVVHIPKNKGINELILDKTRKPTRPIYHYKGLFTWRNFFIFIDKCSRYYELLPWKPGRAKAIKKALNWIIQRQQSDGTWGGNCSICAYSLLALNVMMPSVEHSALITKGLKGILESLSMEHKDTLQIEIANSPVWDTCLMLNALLAVNLSPKKEFMQKALRFLLQHQVLTGGDWQIKNPNLAPGGFTFHFYNNPYPDIDDTAEVLITLSRYRYLEEVEQAISRATQWMLKMQSRNGGWGSFDRDNDKLILTQLPCFDFGDILDPPSVDITAHVLEALGALNYSLDQPQIKRALEFIFSRQEDNGSWFGRWGVNYIYGTSAVLVALRTLNYDMSVTHLQRATKWLLCKQNTNGGWGESCSSYYSSQDRGKGPSTASQTAWALMGLISAGLWQDPQVTKGIEYLCNSINSQGTWNEHYFTGCLFCGYLTGLRPEAPSALDPSRCAMAKYEYYPHYWPLRALGMYQHCLQQSVG